MRFSFASLPAGRERRRSIDHVEQLGFLLVNGGRSYRGSVFQIRAVGGQLQDVLDHDRLAVFMLGLSFGDQRGDVGGRGIRIRREGGCWDQTAPAAIIKARVTSIIRMENLRFRFELRCYHNSSKPIRRAQSICDFDVPGHRSCVAHVSQIGQMVGAGLIHLDTRQSGAGDFDNALIGAQG